MGGVGPIVDYDKLDKKLPLQLLGFVDGFACKVLQPLSGNDGVQTGYQGDFKCVDSAWFAQEEHAKNIGSNDEVRVGKNICLCCTLRSTLWHCW